MKIDLIEILACPICKNPDLELIVIEQKPIMLPDDLRNKEEDKKFLNTHQKEIPSHILKSGKPVSLN
ncbi:MAG: hypothetical protein ACTSQ9_05450 [Candidatus Hodarchaeales archaeon]